MFMKKIFLYLLLSAFAISCFAQKQVAQPIGSKTLYQPKQKLFTLPPAGFKAVYINYVGRHGARHLTKDIKLSYAYNIIAKADSLGLLTASGKSLKQMILNLGKEETGHVASISKSGEDELKGIAARMYANQRNVFSTAAPILVSTTKKGRTKESAEAFLQGLKQKDSTLLAMVKFNYADDDHLRFYDFSKSYEDFKEKGNWAVAYQKLVKAKQLNNLANQFASKFFNSSYLSKLSDANKIDFIEDIYGFYTILGALGSEINEAGLSLKDVDFKSLFTNADLAALGTLGDAEDFLTKGPGLNNHGIQVRIAAPLLADFINTTDAFLKSKPVVADLRFSHAETIAPFAALLNIKGASESTKDILTFNHYWQAENVIPFSSNIQWIIYQNKSTGQTLVKFMLNEKEVSINGLATKTFPYYRWSSVRNYYLMKLKSLNLSPDGDMHEYLLKVK
jgi:multiple inositol-polyphosphate phosphatase/2,3-bisphosphoglycerate 3-phosphatase